MKKYILTLLAVCFSFSSFSQKKKVLKLGQTTRPELEMSIYPKDSTANAVVLFEEAFCYVDEKRNYKFTTDHYYRIKILTKEGKEKANISVDLYKKEEILDIKAFTYNIENGAITKIPLTKKDIFTKKVSDKYRTVSFTLPNIKKGSVIEYSYSITSPYNSIDSWYYQSDIPKIESSFSTLLLANWRYKKRMTGYLKLSTAENKIKKNCMYVDGAGQGDCISSTFIMKDIPTFEDEDYMTSKENFISKVSYDLESFTNIRGRTKKYTTDWKKAELTLKRKFLNNQSEKKSFFRRNLPENVNTISLPLERAKKIFSFIQGHYTWNRKNWYSSEINIKRAFKEKSGGIDDINISLYNAFKSSGIDANLVLVSTRRNGIPTKLYPVITQFNYILVKATIEGKEYFLDASDKNYSFGFVPFKCLNGEARVLDFDKGGYWQKIKSGQKSQISYRLNAKLNQENQFEIDLHVKRSGYYAYNLRNELDKISQDQYIEELEEGDLQDAEVEDFNFENLDKLDDNVIQKMKILIDTEIDSGNEILFNPILFIKTVKNPFQSKDRLFPIDYGYKRKYTYKYSFQIPEGFELKNLPENNAKKLPAGDAFYIYRVWQKGDKLNVYIKFQTSKSVISGTQYFYLKELYKSMIQSEKSMIKLVKK